MEISSFGDLEDFLRKWKSFKDRDVYDLNGIAALLTACLDNMRDFMSETDFDEIGECFTDQQKEFLAKLSKHL